MDDTSGNTSELMKSVSDVIETPELCTKDEFNVGATLMIEVTEEESMTIEGDSIVFVNNVNLVVVFGCSYEVVCIINSETEVEVILPLLGVLLYILLDGEIDIMVSTVVIKSLGDVVSRGVAMFAELV